MIHRMLAVQPLLYESGRLPALARTSGGIRAVELVWLVLMGLAAAAATSLLDFKLRIPGHAILRCILPMTLGLALVPRRGAGLIMSASAVAGGLGVQLMGPTGLGAGALTSLTVSGVLLELAAARVRQGWQWYLGIGLAALGTNLAAFGVKLGAKMAGMDGPMRQPVGVWWPRAAISYPLCGLIAGLVAAAILFRLRGRHSDLPEQR